MTIEEKIQEYVNEMDIPTKSVPYEKKRIMALCREFALSCKPEKAYMQEMGHKWSTKKFETYYAKTQEKVDAYNSALEEWEENINKLV